MRFDRLELLRWGALEGVTFDLSAGARGLHVIYGDNEAGKSTSRRAISALLFGIPLRTSDNFRFPNKALRLGGTVRFGAEAPFTFERRKGSKDTLVDAAGAPLSEALLQRALGGVDRETFEREWSLDHERLRIGGADLLRGEGELGQSLLAAGLGGIGVGALKDELEAEARELFGKRSGKVYLLLDQIKERRRARDMHAVDTALVEEQRARIAGLVVERTAAEAAARAARQELTRLDRAQRAQAVLAEHDGLLVELGRFAGLPLLREDFGARRVAAEQAREAAQVGLNRGRRDVTEGEQRLATIVVDDGVLADGEAIDHLESGLQAYLRRVTERGGWELDLVACADAITVAARSVGLPTATLLTLASGPYRALQDELHDLTVAGAEARVANAETTKALRSAEAELAAFQANHAPPAPPGDGPPDEPGLQEAFDAARRELGTGDAVTKRVKEARVAAERAHQQAEAGLAALPYWTRGPLGRRALETARLPSAADIDASATKLASSARADEARAEERAARSLVEQRIREVEALRASDVVTDADLATARAKRDEGWRLLRETGGSTARSRASWGKLADAHERDLEHADRVADRLRVDADRASKLEAAEVAARSAAEQLESTTRRLDNAIAAESQAKAEWQALWAPFGIVPAAPDTMQVWLETAHRVRKQLEDDRRLGLELARTARHVDENLGPVARLLNVGAAQEQDAGFVLREAERRLQARREREQQQQADERELGRMQGRLVEAEARAKRTSAVERAWSDAWTSFGAKLALERVRSPNEVRATFDAVTEVARLRERASDLRLQLEVGRRLEDEYLREVAHVASTSTTEPVEVARRVQTLVDCLRVARAADRTRDTELARLKDAARRVERDADQLALADAELARLWGEAGAPVEQLASLESQSAERRELSVRLDAARRELSMVATDGVDRLREDVLRLTRVDVGSHRAALELSCEQAQASAQQRSEEIGALVNELEKVAGGAAAAEDESALQGLIASVGKLASDYLRLSFAAQMLGQAAASYRDKNQNPILVRASDLLRRLTGGSFTGVVVDDDLPARGNRDVLKGLRGAHELVGVDAMSDGVRDQLFLALRLAALERQLDGREPLPFVVDDILIHLSDARAHATLDVLAELASRTQVLLFTHHARIVELARRLEGREVFVHTMGAPG